MLWYATFIKLGNATLRYGINYATLWYNKLWYVTLFFIMLHVKQFNKMLLYRHDVLYVMFDMLLHRVSFDVACLSVT